ncbi:MAG: hypothetical protein DRQ55_14135 [Planctomycetota bacterium]|nr:MAG: hypothetical protein DRQ55_14135 [Planctomycetota bacterium]
MAWAETTRDVQAPIERVFDAVAHIESFQQIVPEITQVEFLSEQRRGLGARFRETRVMGGREASTELKVTEYVENERIRLEADAGGTIWDTTFSTTPGPDGSVTLTMVMEANAYKLSAKLMLPAIKGMIHKAIMKDMDAVKAHCEAGTG